MQRMEARGLKSGATVMPGACAGSIAGFDMGSRRCPCFCFSCVMCV